MSISNWVNNNKVTVSFHEYRDLVFLVYTSDVIAHRVLLVEDINSGIRKIPDQRIAVKTGNDMDKVIQETMDYIIDLAGYGK